MDALHPNHPTNQTLTTSKRRPPVAAEYLDGQSPNERSQEKRLRVLEWVYRWGWSSADIINIVSGQATKGYATKLVQAGLLRETLSSSVHLKRFFTLTADGLAEIERHISQLLPYPEIRPLRVRQELIRHQLIAQRLTLEYMKYGPVADVVTERMYPDLTDKAGVKRPDVVWHCRDGLVMAVEVELTSKWGRKLDEFILKISDSIHKYSAGYVVFTDSPAIHKRYSAAMAEGATVSHWEKDHRGYWYVSATQEIEADFARRVQVRLVDEHDKVVVRKKSRNE